MTKAEEWLETQIGGMTEDICTLVRIPSISEPGGPDGMPFGAACAQVVDAALSIGSRMGFVPENHEHYCGTLLWKGSRKEEIGIFGHGDVVPAGSGWTSEPFEPVIRDGLMIGRGVSDNKGSLMAALYALYFLKESGYQPKYSYRFFIGTDEEKGMEDIQYYTAHYEQPVFSIVPDVMFPVCNGEKGVLELDAEYEMNSRMLLSFSAGIMSNAVPADAFATVRTSENGAERLRFSGCGVEEVECGIYRIHTSGIAAHAAFPESSDSAEVKLARALLDAGILDEDGTKLMEGIVSLFHDYYGAGLGTPYSDEISGKLTHVGGIASGGDGIFRQNMNIRYPVTADYDGMIRQMKKTLESKGFRLVHLHNSAPCYVEPETAAVKKLTEVCSRHLGMEAAPYVMGGGTYARKLKRAVGFGPGIPGKENRFGTERGGAHQPDEYIEIEHLKKAFLIYVDAIRELDQIEQF